MKTVLKFLTLGLIFAAFGAISVTNTFAQATVEECDAIYNQKFLANRTAKEAAKLEISVNGGKEYLEKCGALTGQEEVKAYVEKQLPNVTKRWEAAKWDEQVIQPFNSSFAAKNWDVTFDKGKQIIAKEPDFLDVMLVLASVGFDRAAEKNDKFNADAINMAKMALQKMIEGKPSITGDYGAAFPGGVGFVYKTKTCTDGKTNATGWMNYTIGYITFYRQNNQKDAAPYLYKATQVGCETKNMGDIYRMIASFYVEEFKKLDEERVKKITAAGEKDTDETKAMFALQRGYMERIVDAYARASKLATTPATKDAWLNLAKTFYKFRFNDDVTGFDKWVADATAKPFTDPTTTVTPIVVEDTKATTTGATKVSSDTSSAPVAETRPRTAETTAKTGAAANTTTKAPAKKPAPKKKGTR
jgi:hypothetical protein